MGIPDLRPIVAAINRMADGLYRLAAAQEEANKLEKRRGTK